MDMTVILTGFGTATAIVTTNIALIAWLRSDMKSFENEVRGWREDTHKEMKDFHGRLCHIEENRRRTRHQVKM